MFCFKKCFYSPRRERTRNLFLVSQYLMARPKETHLAPLYVKISQMNSCNQAPLGSFKSYAKINNIYFIYRRTAWSCIVLIISVLSSVSLYCLHHLLISCPYSPYQPDRFLIPVTEYIESTSYIIGSQICSKRKISRLSW